jgi:hypothetical protein
MWILKSVNKTKIGHFFYQVKAISVKYVLMIFDILAEV